MKQVFTTLLVMVCSVSFLAAQNVVTTSALGQSPQTFVSENLGGPGVYIFNVTHNGSSSSIAYNNIGTLEANGFDGIPFEKGLMLATGHIELAEGPIAPGAYRNTAKSAGSDGYSNSTYSDPTIQALLGTITANDCSSIEFDFVSLTSSLNFNYVFGSMEYETYTCSNFNDQFVLMLTGPDPITGEEVTRNIALIPGSDTIWGGKYPDGIAVAINSVNRGACSGSSTPSEGMFLDFADYYIENYADDGDTLYGLTYFGFTTKLYASAAIVPCQKYHMHIAICDASDYSFDSGVIIESGTFSAPNAAIGLSVPGMQNVSGYCPKGVPLTLANTAFDNATVHFSSVGSAQLGVDYDIVDKYGNVINTDGMQLDNTSRSFYVQARNGIDLTANKTTDLILTTSICAEYPQLQLSDTMHFLFSTGGGVQLGDTLLDCNEACLKVTAPLRSGNDPITYRWEPTTGIDHPYQRTSTAYITSNAEYKLIATGGSGCMSDTATVKINIKGSEWVGIDEVEDGSVALFPNPATDAFQVKAEGLMAVELYTTDGRRLIERTFNHVDGTVSISLDEVEAGIYGVRVVTERGMNAYKIVVNK